MCQPTKTDLRKLHHFMGETLQAVAFTLDENGYLKYIDEKAFDWWQYGTETLQHKNFLELIAAQDRQRAEAFIGGMSNQVEAAVWHGHILSASGTKWAVRWLARWEEQDRLIYCVVQARHLMDQSDPLELRLPMEDRGRQMDDILDRIEEGFTILDQDWNILYTNQGAERISGRKKAGLLGKNLWELYPETKGTLVEQQYRKAVREQIPVLFQTLIPAPYHLWLEIKAYPSKEGLTLFFVILPVKKRQKRKGARFVEKWKNKIPCSMTSSRASMTAFLRWIRTGR